MHRNLFHRQQNADSGPDLLGWKGVRKPASPFGLWASMVCAALMPGQVKRAVASSPTVLSTHLAQDLAAGRPAQPLGQAVEEPEPGEGHDGGAPGEDHVDQAHHEEAGGEEPAGAHLVRKDAADELADGVGCRLAAGDETCGGQTPGAPQPAERPPLGRRGRGARTHTHPGRPSPAAPRP